MLPILFAFLSFFGWGSGDIFGTIAVRRMGTYSTTFWEYIFTLVLSSFYIPFIIKDFSKITPDILIINILLGIIFVISIMTFYEALRIGNASLVGTISSAFSALVVIFSLIFLKEALRLAQILTMLPIFLGLFLVTFNSQELRKGKFKMDRSVVLAIITMFLWAVYFTFIKIPVRQLGWFLPAYIGLFFFPIILLFAKFQNVKIKPPTFQGSFIPLTAAVLLLRIADYSFNYAIGKGLTSIVAPIAGSYPTLFVVLAFLFLKDPITRQQIFGIITTLVGIVLLSIFSA